MRAFALLAVAAALAGCLDGPAVGPTLTLAGTAYTPARLEASPGATVTVVNRDPVTHTATAVGGAFDTRDVPPGGVATFVAPVAPGEHPFRCGYHPEMRGILVVSRNG